MRTSRLPALLLAPLVLAGCTTTVAEPSPTVTVTQPVTVTPTASPGAYPPGRGPSGDQPVVPDGTWLVGEDIEVGTLGLPETAYECRWKVTDSTGRVVEETVESSPRPTGVKVQEGDLFQSDHCFAWRLFPAAESTPSIDVPTHSKYLGRPVYDGTYVVGESLPPGDYELIKPVSGPCSFSVKFKAPNGNYLADTSFNSSNYGARSIRGNFFTLERGDLFETSGCGTWQRYKIVFI